MKSYTETEPFFSDTIKITEVTDPGHADFVNEAPKQLLKNTIANKKEIDKIKEESTEYLKKTGDSEGNTVEFESNDSENATSWTDVSVMESKETHKSLFEKVSTMFKNVRFLYKILGSEDISQIVDGTVTGILHELKLVALTGSYDDLDDTPNELPASDVYSWAKQATKPSYNKTDVGLGAVNNTSDLDKPVSTAQQTELGKKVNIASILESIEQVDANTTAKNIVDALVIKALKANLMNSINQINSNLIKHGWIHEAGEDLNNYLDEGRYTVSSTGMLSMQNLPPGVIEQGWGILIVFNGGAYKAQFFINSEFVFIRAYAENWLPWKSIT